MALHSLAGDLRFGTRMIGKTKGASVISVLALACGIGLTTMMFSIIWGAILRGLPFPESDRILHVGRTNLSRDIERMSVPLHDYLDWREQQRSFEDLAAFSSGTVNLSGAEKPERYDGAFLTANTFDMLRARPLLGRTFRADEDRTGAEPVILLGYNIWRDRYGSDPDILGKTVRANGRVSTIVGVMPERFAFPGEEEVWIPLGMDPLAIERGEGEQLEVVGRLRHGASIDEAVTELGAIARRLALEYPKTNEGVGVVVQPYVEAYIGDEAIAMLYTMLGAVFCILLIACANVANLMLGRASMRAKEVGIRSALGASRWRVAVQFLAESLLLAGLGAVLGLGIAYLGIDLFNDAIESTQPPFWIDIKLDPAALLFALALTLIACVLAGSIPALQAARADVNTILKDESRGSSSFRLGRISKVLVILEIALSCALLVAAGLMIKSVVKLRTVDLGFPTEDVFTARIGLPEVDYPDEASQIRFFEELLPRLRSLPGVSSAALTSRLPGLFAEQSPVALEGAAYAAKRDYPQARTISVTPGFLETFQMRPREGRDFKVQDVEGSLPVAIVNESFARRHFPGGSPIGRRLRVGDDESEEPWRTIVGVIPDLRAGGIDEKEDPEALYMPLAQNGQRFMSVAAKTRGTPGAITGQVRDAVSALDPDLPIYFVDPLDAVLARENWFYGVFGTLFMIFGSVALFLAGIGLYGVMSFSVGQRTREMGVRMALGAQARDVMRLILRQGLIQLAIGLVLGLALALAFTHFLTIVLFGVDPRDPAIFAAIVLVLAAAAALACLIPARRATRVDPIVALRYE